MEVDADLLLCMGLRKCGLGLCKKMRKGFELYKMDLLLIGRLCHILNSTIRGGERNFFLHSTTISIFLREINFLEVIFNGTFPILYAFEVEKFHMYNYSSRTSW